MSEMSQQKDFLRDIVDTTDSSIKAMSDSSLDYNINKLYNALNGDLSGSPSRLTNSLLSRGRDIRAKMIEERDRRNKQKLIEQYDEFVTQKNNATTESAFENLAKQFRQMGNYKNATSLAKECEVQYQKLKEKREQKIASALKARDNKLLLLQLGILALFAYLLFQTDILELLYGDGISMWLVVRLIIPLFVFSLVVGNLTKKRSSSKGGRWIILGLLLINNVAISHKLLGWPLDLQYYPNVWVYILLLVSGSNLMFLVGIPSVISIIPGLLMKKSRF